MNLCSGSDKGLSDSRAYSIRKIIHRLHGIVLHKGALLSYITWRTRKGKGLEAPCKYIYYYGSAKDPAFILF